MPTSSPQVGTHPACPETLETQPCPGACPCRYMPRTYSPSSLTLAADPLQPLLQAGRAVSDHLFPTRESKTRSTQVGTSPLSTPDSTHIPPLWSRVPPRFFHSSNPSRQSALLTHPWPLHAPCSPVLSFSASLNRPGRPPHAHTAAKYATCPRDHSPVA